MIATTQLSKYRKQLRELIDLIDKLAFQCAHDDPLIQGTPGEVFRTCGQKSCKCKKGLTFRHGPYMTIQIYEGKKRRQVAIRKDQKHLWQQAKNYQSQTKTLLKLKNACTELTEAVKKILTQRRETFP